MLTHLWETSEILLGTAAGCTSTQHTQGTDPPWLHVADDFYKRQKNCFIFGFVGFFLIGIRIYFLFKIQFNRFM